MLKVCFDLIGQTTNPDKTRRARSTRLLAIGLVAAFVLISLPVMPLRLSFSGPIAVPDFSQIVNFGRFFEQHTPPTVATHNPVAHPQANLGPAHQITVLERTLHELSAQATKSPQEPALQNQIGLVYFAIGELDESLIHFRKAVDLSREALLNLEERQQRLQGQDKEASSLYVESARISIELSGAHSNLARTYEKLGQHEKVMAELAALSKEGVISAPAPSKDNARRHLSREIIRHLACGESLMASKQYWQAMHEFKNVIAVDPQVALAHHQLGLAAALTHNVDMAVEEFQHAVRLTPSDAIARNNLGLALMASGETKQAETQFRKATDLKPKLTDAAINLANLYCLSKQYGKARQCLEQAILRNPNSAIAHNNLAAVWELEGNYPESIKEFHQSITLAPQMASAHYGLGLALSHCKNYLPAISEFKRAVVLDPRLSGVHDKLEHAHRKAGLALGGAYGMN